jgi:transposase-like protein
MGKPRRKYTEEFKRDAVRMMRNRGTRTVTEVADDLGVGTNLLHRWRAPSGSNAKPNGTEPMRSPRARLAASAAQVRARIKPCSYWAAPSMTVRMNASAGESPLPSPLALTRRAPAFVTARSTIAASTTWRAMRSRLATTSTPARYSQIAARAARSPGRSAIGETLRTPWSVHHTATRTPSRLAYASMLVR